MTKRTMASIFSSLALGTALVAGTVPDTAHAEEPVSACKTELIQDTFNTARGGQAFGRDGCVYNIVMGQPLPVKNYDLDNGREAQRFASEYNRAQRNMEREIARQQREQQRQQQRCEKAQNDAINRGLNDLLGGRGVQTRGAARVLTECGLRR